MPRRQLGAAGGLTIGRAFAAVVSLALTGLLGFVGFYERAYQRATRALEADVLALRQFRWERPVLRGPAGDGNAAAEIYAALADWKPLSASTRGVLADKVFYGQTLSEAEAGALMEREGQLRALRAAVQQRWSHTDLVVERGVSLRVPPYPRLLEAGLLLLAQAESAQGESCLQLAADAIRLGQDLVPAAPLEAASASSHLSALAARVIPRCARDTDLAGLRRSSRELHVLAAHAPPIGSAIELEELVQAMELRRRAALAGQATPWHVALAVLERPQLLAAWRMHERPTRFRAIAAEHYPDAMEEWKRELDYRLAASSEAGKAAEHVLGRLCDDMRGQAIVRMLALGLATLAERAYRGSLPPQPTGLREAALLDPFRGQPFNYRLAANGGELTLWSVGEDFRDDGGTDDWNGPAPRDVTLHFPLGPRDQKLAKRP
jgi:hypothetical protein